MVIPVGENRDSVWNRVIAFLALGIYYQRRVTGTLGGCLRDRIVPVHVVNAYCSIERDDVSLQAVLKSFLKCWLMVLMSVWYKMRMLCFLLIDCNENLSFVVTVFAYHLEIVDAQFHYLRRPLRRGLFSRNRN